MKIPISFADLTHTRQGIACNTFPLGVSFVASHALKKFKDKIKVDIFKYPDDLKEYLEKETPKVACFSSYSWNIDLSHKFATKIKEKSPTTITVFGGPNYPIFKDKQKEFLLSYPNIDFYIEREGEQAFVELFDKFLEYDFKIQDIKEENPNMANCNYILKGNFIKGDLISRLSNLDEIPSPYLNGLSDKFFDGKLTPLVGTTRGCPFSCTYCQEGQPYFNKISRFSLERIKKEFNYIAQRVKTPDLIIVDSNFGMYEQDIEISKSLALSRKKYNWPKFLVTSTGKNKKNIALECAKLLDGKSNLSASVQSTDKQVLKNIKRENISMEQMIELTKEGERIGARGMGEVILNLPGDSKKTHFKSVFDMIDSEVNILRSYQLVLLPGSEVSSKENIEKYNLETSFRVIPNCFGNYNVYNKSFPSAEIDEIVTSSKNMSDKDYLDCRLLTLTTEIFYNGKIFNELINFLKLKDIPASNLMKNIYEKFLEDSGGMKEICNGYLKENKRKLWKEKSKLENFLQDPKNIEDYGNKDSRSNEIFKYKSLSFLEKMEELHKIAFNETKSLLNPLDKEDNNYLNELFEFSLLRKKDLFQLNKKSTKKFHYDFVSLLANNFNENPFSYFIPQGINIEISYSDEQKEMISKYINQYGSSVNGVGKILHYGDVSNLYREASYK